MKIIEYNTLKNKNMPKYNVIYYLKKYHSPLITQKKSWCKGTSKADFE